MIAQHRAAWLGLVLAWFPVACPAADDQPAPTAKPEQMQAPAKMRVNKPLSSEPGKLSTPNLPGVDERILSVDQYRIQILKQEMEFNPEIREKVEKLIELKKQEYLSKKALQEKEAPENEQTEFKGWLFDNLRKLYRSQGKELPEILQTADKFEKMNNQGGKEPGWEDATSPEEFMEAWQREQQQNGMEMSLSDQLAMANDEEPTLEQMMVMPLSERLKHNRERYSRTEGDEAYDNALEQARQEEEADPEADNELLALPKPGSEDEDWMEEDETLAIIENESAKETFGPGKLQWFENKEDTLPIAGPSAPTGMQRQQLTETWKELEELSAQLEEADRDALPHRNIGPENFNRPGVDIPVATFVENARTEIEEVRKAQQIQDSIKRSKENRSRMLRPSMDIYSTRRIMKPHDLLGPNAFRAWDDSRFNAAPKSPAEELPPLE